MNGPILQIPWFSVLPFAGLISSVAALPVCSGHFWERNRTKAIVSLGLALPVALWLALKSPALLVETIGEYLSFVILLGALFTIAGGIHLAGDLRATAANNTAILAAGGILANVIGTTGASMLVIRLALRTNHQRKNVTHLPFFFILIVSNCGGLLTPLGDPPLFLGYLRGVPFTWTLQLWPVWLAAVGYLLALFYWIDRRAYAREDPMHKLVDDEQASPLRLEGWINLLLLVLLLLAVFLPSPWREITMLVLAGASHLLGPSSARQKNDFSFNPLVEVAVIFAGVFVTMVPALLLLEQHGSALGLQHPWQFFLATGAFSSILDNAPTYLSFVSAAQSASQSPEVIGIPHRLLAAISCGAVLMGANTYIGNGPNFMVKVIAESSGYRTASFARHAVAAMLVLAPLYVFTCLWLAR